MAILSKNPGHVRHYVDTLEVQVVDFRDSKTRPQNPQHKDMRTPPAWLLADDQQVGRAPGQDHEAFKNALNPQIP